MIQGKDLALVLTSWYGYSNGTIHLKGRKYLSFHVTRNILTYTGYWSARDGIIYFEVLAPELLCHLGHVVLGCPRAKPAICSDGVVQNAKCFNLPLQNN